MAAASVLLAATAAVAPANACTCGAIAPAPGAAVNVTDESAILSYADGIESIQLSLGVESAIASAGLIIPTPSPATVVAGDEKLFQSLDAQIAPREHQVDDWWGTMVDPAATTEPTVLASTSIGGLEATALSASDMAGLAAWLGQRGFALTPEVSAQLAQYVAKGWYFVAVALTNDDHLDGRLEPINVSFPTTSLVYPIGLTRATDQERSLRLRVVSDHRVDVVQAGTSSAPLNAAERVVWAGPVTEKPLAALGSYLTVVDLRFDNPAAQVSTDIGLTFSPNDDVVEHSVMVVRPIQLLGFPLGTLLAVWGALGLLGLLGAIIARSRLR